MFMAYGDNSTEVNKLQTYGSCVLLKQFSALLVQLCPAISKFEFLGVALFSLQNLEPSEGPVSFDSQVYAWLRLAAFGAFLLSVT